MSDELFREQLRGELGKRIDLDLKVQLKRRESLISDALRKGTAYDECRYMQGLADGIELALNTIKLIGKS